MSDLVKRLRDDPGLADCEEAADRIEALDDEKIDAHRKGYAQGKSAGDIFARGLHDHIIALEATIERQASASKTLREHTLAEVQHLKDMDRSEYNATKMLDSEREANEILTAEVEALEARVEAADKLAAWARAISERKASPTTGGRLILERDIVGLETALDAYEATKEHRE